MENTNKKQMFFNFRKDFKECIKPLEEKYNVDISLNNITYNDIEFHTKLKAIFLRSDKTSEQIEFEQYCRKYGLTPDDYKRTVSIPYNDKTYELIGFSVKAKKYPYLLKCLEDNKVYKAANINF